jgi:hypothetical protein
MPKYRRIIEQREREGRVEAHREVELTLLFVAKASRIYTGARMDHSRSIVHLDDFRSHVKAARVFTHAAFRISATRIFMHAAFRISAATTDRRRTPAIMCGHLTLGYQPLLLNLLLLVFLRIIRARLAECAFRVITFLPPLRGKGISPLIQKRKGEWKMSTQT